MKILKCLAVIAGLLISTGCFADQPTVNNQAGMNLYFFYPNKTLRQVTGTGSTAVNLKGVCGSQSTCNVYYGITGVGQNVTASFTWDDVNQKFLSVGSCEGSPVCATLENPTSLNVSQ